jgi:YHS domain-containing protein
MRTLVSLGFFLVAALLGAAAEKPVNTTLFGVALKGYDVVAYFTDAQPVEGSTEFTHAWNGATWRFASAAHRDAFAAAPEKFAPQFGGYCAWAVSRGYTAPIDPAAWKIVGGKLYLNYSREVQAKWETDVPGHIAKAEANWPKLIGK